MKKTKNKNEKAYKVLSSEELRKINGGRWIIYISNGKERRIWIND